MLTTPYYYIISSNYIVGLFITHYQVGLFHDYGHITFIIPLGTSLGPPYFPP
jgi:hypothetical protein